MKSSFLLILLLSLGVTFCSQAFTHNLNLHDSQEVCIHKKTSTLFYDAQANGTFIKLNSIQGLVQILLGFDFPENLESFWNELVNAVNANENRTFITADKGASCYNHPMMKRMFEAVLFPSQGFIIMVLGDAKYDQVFENAHLSLAPSQVPCEPPQWDDKLCLGWNTKDCATAEGQFQVWSSTYLNVMCQDCFVGLDADVFFDVHITDFSLSNMSTGFKNVNVNAALVFDFVAHASWSTGVDKTMPIVSQANAFDFWLGPVPFHLWFDIPLELQASASFNAQASVVLGATADLDLGELVVSWASGKGWSTVTPSPKFSWTPQLTEPSAMFQASAQLSLVPSFSAHFDELFTATTTLTPVLRAQAQGHGQIGHGGSVCAQMDYEVSASVFAELSISIPWVDVHDDYTWQKTLFDTGNQQIGKICTNITLDSRQRYYPKLLDPFKPGKDHSQLRPTPSKLLAAVPRNVRNVHNANHTVGVSLAKKPSRAFSGAHEVCLNGKVHQLAYDVAASGDFVQLESVPGISSVTCNIDTTRVLVNFTSGKVRDSFLSQLSFFTTFITAGSKWKCNDANMMRRVLSWKKIGLTAVDIATQEGLYSEVFDKASITFGPNPQATPCTAPAAPQEDWQICLPVNADETCSHAQQTFPIYQGEYLTITCTNCFIGLKMDVFFDIEMFSFALDSFQAGFRDINIDGGVVVDFLATLDWSTGVDKSIPLITPTQIIDLWIGPIPLTVSMEIPVEIKMDANFDATATATIGATADWDIGDAYITWKWDDGWGYVGPNPHLTWTPVVVAPTAQFTAAATFAIIPSWTLSVDGFYTLTYDLDPTLDMTAQGTINTKTGNMCAKLTDQIELDMQSQLYISIPWFALSWSDSWSSQIYNSGVNLIGQKCISINTTLA